jgi:hypothetical protein
MDPLRPSAMTAFPLPSPENAHLSHHIRLLRDSLRSLTGRELVDPALTDVEGAEAAFRAPFVLLSHNAERDPILTYANLCALELFEFSWDDAIALPSRLTAAAPERAERDRLLVEVAANGYIDDYSGIRISRNGRRFRIKRATVWKLTDEAGHYHGQAATFREWAFL